MSSIHDVAKRAGVSTATVSRTFRYPGLLTEETQRRVLEAARQLNYYPRSSRVKTVDGAAQAARDGRAAATARTAASAAHDAIGFQFFADRASDVLQSNSFYAAMLMGAQEEAAALGLNLLVHATDRHRLATRIPKMVVERAVAGMLLVGSGSDASARTLFAERVPHVVLLDDHDPAGRLECVTSDGFGGAAEATRYLIELGHRRIGFLLMEEAIRSFQDRLDGYVAALFRAGIIPDPGWIVGGCFEDPEAERRGRLAMLMSGANRPTALLAANDDYAYGALRLLRDLGLSVPNDVSLIGFDDNAFSTHTEPPLTTVRVDKEGMGRLAVRRLYTRMKTEGAPLPPAHSRVPVSLVVRHTCRAIS